MNSKTQYLCPTSVNGLKDSTPLGLTTKISPGSISLINSASIKSNAQVSDATTTASSSFPRTSGLNPYGSIVAIMNSGERNGGEDAPLHLIRASIILFLKL